MHATKGGWVVQTFALAKCNDSGGKKSRIRRSKEERKALVESFIKKYQKIHNGSFPSLNLTHKEVGGSFYTVREIVREVIQENRVLGPVKLTSEEQSPDRFLAEYPLGSIALEPETDLYSSNGSHLGPVKLTSEEQNPDRLLGDHPLGSISVEPQTDLSSSNGSPLGPVKLTSEEQNPDRFLGDYPLESISLESETDLSSSNGSPLSPVKLTSEDQSPDRFLGEYPLGSVSIEPETDLSSSNGSPLSPVKLTSEDQSPDRFLGEYPLGSVSIEPETDLSSSNGSPITTHILPSHHQDTSEELVSNSVVQFPESEHRRFDGGQTINGSIQAVEQNEEYDKAIHTESHARESVELEENVAELEASKAQVTHVAANVIVETFPLKSGSRVNYGLDETYSEPSELTGTLIEKEIEKVETKADRNNSVVDGMNFLESSFDLENVNAEANLASPSFEKHCDLVEKKPVSHLEAPLLENTNGAATKEVILFDTKDSADPDVKYASRSGTKAIDAQNGIHAVSFNVNITSISSEQSISTKEISSQSNPNVENGVSAPKGSNPTLDRMNLESWETPSEKSDKPETNPLLAFFKSFISVLVKFWSE